MFTSVAIKMSMSLPSIHLRTITSVSHRVIDDCLNHYPEPVRKYITNLYADLYINISSIVSNKSPLPFKHRVLQRHTHVIFHTSSDSLLECPQKESHHRYGRHCICYTSCSPNILSLIQYRTCKWERQMKWDSLNKILNIYKLKPCKF